ncbi:MULTISPECIES: FtsX-like permease family protein [Micromonospora]|uniref:FtsX-like permease family protein n=1 Tax=Micromonospora antibiotica TaxID=2807623 RepID=A0ABS3VD75_9ACTN|nr:MULTISPECIES: ABC transporter permease [Micromonospora]ALA09378.1 ABC transporter [Micromonospora sp. RL09-050-HVF-A]MBO4163583.1 FtsX-like permease family protein [Micromonospora antibiotica]MBW4705817.1 FtsX-like permease family protein [Micromonospora sp. RL09-050-HVF-A]
MTYLAWRTLRYRKLAFIATFIAVFFGVALIVACGGLMETGIRMAVPPQRLAAADVVVSGKQTYGVPKKDPQDTKNIKSVPLAERYWIDPGLVSKIQGVPGVERAVAESSFAATVVRNGAPVIVGTQSLGHGWESAQLGPYRLDGQPPAQAGQVVLDRAVAKLARVKVGDRVDVVVGGVTSAFQVSGIATPPGEVSQSALFFSGDDERRLNPHTGTSDAIGVLAKPGTDVEALRERIERTLADRKLVVLTGDDRGAAEFPEAVGGQAQLIPLSGVFAGMTVFVAIFVVASTLGLSVQQRQKEIALLRSIGATPRQIRTMVRREALVVAVGAAILGCAPGVFLGPLLYHIVSDAGVISPVVEFHQGFVPYLAAPAIGIFAAMVAAYVAGRRPSKIRPTAGIAEAAVQRKWVSWPRVVFSILFFAAGFALILVTAIVMQGAVASATAGPAVMCWAISIALISPGLTRLFAAVLSVPVRAFFGLAGYLGTVNVRTRAVRVASAVTPIMLAVALAVANFYLQTTQNEAAERYYSDNLRADLVLSSTTGGFPAETVEALRSAPGVEDASAYVTSAGWINKPYDGSHVESPWPLQGVSGASAASITGVRTSAGNLGDLRGDTVALPEVAGKNVGVGVGDQITLRLGDRSAVDLRVVALYPAKKGFETILLPADLLAAHSTTGLSRQILVTAEPGTSRDALTASLREKVAGHPGTMIEGRDAITTFAERTKTQAWVNYLLVALVAGYTMISVANTLIVATAGRRRELGMQRLIGATRKQALQMLSVEAGMVAVIGVVLGTIASVATLLPFSIVVLGRPVPSGPIWIYLAVVAGAAVLAFAATVLPGRRVMLTRPAEAAVAVE